ncbi:MAG TPA: ABC transporter permease subunit [Gammaproteobacteria bacterium]|jgi:spermidine/putrescine transport system permease protein|nr:ABC transporter permease subunit [Gammaproteobacteria bacterium]
MKRDAGFKHFSLTVVWSWLFLFALLPFSLVVIASWLSHHADHFVSLPFTVDNYRALNNLIYLHIFERSFVVAGIATMGCLLLGYPFAYCLARIQGVRKAVLIMLIMIPFWTSSLIRSYALIAILKARGILNSVLLGLGVIHQPLSILFTHEAVIIGLIYNLLPFMVLPILTNVERLDNRLIDAARDLGANRLTVFRKIIIPLTMPGILAGCILVFLPAMTLFYISDILGGAKSILLGNLIQNQFLITQHWPLGSAMSVMLTAVLAVLIALYAWKTRGSKNREWMA